MRLSRITFNLASLLRAAMSEAPKITYTRTRGLAELSRLIFAVKDVEIKEDYLTTKAEFENLKATGKLMFQQIPLLEIDGLCLVETSAQANYLGHKYDMLGGTDYERGRTQMLFAGAQSLFIHGGYLWTLGEPEKKDEDLKAAIEKAKNRYLPAFEKALADNGTGFLVGSSPTIADCSFFSIASHYEEMPEFGDLIEGSPHCKQAFLKKFAEIPGVKKYLNSPRRFPPLNDASIAEVKAAILSK
ncbi:Glutathione S-transferase A1 [Holothuria leucospilota]|uniref:Glutathione S-transferase A1 n=1 Tax=Holothuria leucospilota TaxID=206669 RepID=A0A9Q1C1S9_HOLLE|nr:Glutathione S-transferase A1 [Holothuria leucospilota]